MVHLPLESTLHRLHSQQEINEYFYNYYSHLYSSTFEDAEEGVRDFLDRVAVPQITQEEAEELGAEITIGEVRAALKVLARGKVPGTDGLPAEFFAAYRDLLAPKLVELYQYARETGFLPASSREALVIPLHKAGKPAHDPKAYRPLSMLNVDYKILSRILATRLMPHMNKLIHKDQTGFIPRRNTAINIRRLIAIMESDYYNKSEALVMAVDIEKAFDSLEWEFLYAVLERFGMGGGFLKWTRLLYTNPTARVKVGGIISELYSRKGHETGMPTVSPAVCTGSGAPGSSSKERGQIRQYRDRNGKTPHSIRC